ncbi:hypothetical protein [Winogradskyella sp. PE311]|uniref:hypothetical protein n=1 Tax=Winogradskyella sp. PE311 TaxID=3366943 RepID=UPI00397F1956
MNEKKNIDRLFQEKFKDFEVAPNDAVWNRISESLPNKKKKRRVIPIWWQVGGVAATIALLLTIGIPVFNSDNNTTENNTIVNTKNNSETENNKNEVTNTPSKNNKDKIKETLNSEKLELVGSDKNNKSKKDERQMENSHKEKDNSNFLTSPKNYPNNKAVVNATNKSAKSSSLNNQNNLQKSTNKNKDVGLASNNKTNNSKNNNTSKLVNDKELKSTIKNSVKENNSAVAENSNKIDTTSSNKKTSSEKIAENYKENEIIENLEKESLKEAIAAQKNIIEEEKEEEENRWSIAPNVAPVYFASLGEGSPIHNQFNGNTKSSDINMSYGITGSYALSKKLKVRAGVNRVNLNYTTSDVLAFSGSSTASRNSETQGNIKFKEGASVSIVSNVVLNRASTPEIFNAKITGDLDQRFGFIEVPLELEYRLLDKKFGVNVIGGFSTFFLNQNEIYADLNGATTLIGEASNINSTSFSANFGLGFNYNLSKQWNINLEPQFKYQINTFNNTSGDFRPFFIGVYTGLSFKF